MKEEKYFDNFVLYICTTFFKIVLNIPGIKTIKEVN